MKNTTRLCEYQRCMSLKLGGSNYCSLHQPIIEKPKEVQFEETKQKRAGRIRQFKDNKERRDFKKNEAKVTGLLYGRPVKEVIYKRYRDNAIKRGIDFDLTMEEFEKLWQLPCSYCGSSIDFIGIDRMDNELGYIAGNVTPCCTTCNLTKRNMSAEDYIALCAKVTRHNKQRF